MRARSSIKKIIETLALDAPLTMYSTAEKSKLAKSLVHVNIRHKKRGLEIQNIVKVHSETKWRTGMTSRSYILTFRGVLEYFDILFKEKRVERPEVKRVVQRYGDLLNFSLFKEHEFLARMLGEQVYDLFASVAWLLKNYPPHSPIVAETYRGQLSAFIQVFKDQQFPFPIRDEEEIWMYGYTLIFLQLIRPFIPEEKEKRHPNEILYHLVEATFAKEKKAQKEQLIRIEKLEKTLKSLFAPNPR